jgi:dsRNA-specific ribonuclease
MTSVLDVVAHSGVTRSVCRVLQNPIARQTSLPFAAPPLWATQITPRLQQAFPEVSLQKPVVFVKAFVHPSFTTEYARGSTMASLEPLGNCILQHTLTSWLFSTIGKNGNVNEIREIRSHLLSDESLSFVFKDIWKFEDMILTDAVVQSVRKSSRNQGLVQWLATQESQAMLPLHYHPCCLKAVVGAMFLNGGMSEAQSFVFRHILSHVLDFA